MAWAETLPAAGASIPSSVWNELRHAYIERYFAANHTYNNPGGTWSAGDAIPAIPLNGAIETLVNTGKFLDPTTKKKFVLGTAGTDEINFYSVLNGTSGWEHGGASTGKISRARMVEVKNAYQLLTTTRPTVYSTLDDSTISRTREVVYATNTCTNGPTFSSLVSALSSASWTAGYISYGSWCSVHFYSLPPYDPYPPTCSEGHWHWFKGRQCQRSFICSSFCTMPSAITAYGSAVESMTTLSADFSFTGTKDQYWISGRDSGGVNVTPNAYTYDVRIGTGTLPTTFLGLRSYGTSVGSLVIDSSTSGVVSDLPSFTAASVNTGDTIHLALVENDDYLDPSDAIDDGLPASYDPDTSRYMDFDNTAMTSPGSLSCQGIATWNFAKG